MQIVFEISSVPEEKGGYHLTAFTEGRLTVLLDSSIFLDARGILLVELAVVLHRWLIALKRAPVDLYYASMDFEEEPILALTWDPGQRHFMPASVWAKGSAIPVSLAEAKHAAEEFAINLGSELEWRCGVDLSDTLKAAMRDEPPSPSGQL